jgi:hypothetical protein
MGIDQTYASQVLAGTADPTSIVDFVARWHQGPRTLPLHEFLGLSREDYTRILNHPESAPSVLARRSGPEPSP